MRIFLGTFLGLIAAFFSIALLEPLGHLLFPVPFKIDFNNIDELESKLHLIPFGTHIFVAIVHGLGLAIGLGVSRLIEKNTIYPILIIGGFVVFATIINVFIIPHPLWFSILDLLIVSSILIITIIFLKK